MYICCAGLTGGGTADRSIRLWNASLGTNLSTIDTASQVCAMQWSEPHRELVSSHGFSDNQLCLWKLSPKNNLLKLREFKSHTSRVLHLAKSPDGSRVVSASADESLKFWDIFTSPSSGLGGGVGGGGVSVWGGSSGGLGGLGGLGTCGGFTMR
jgi:cell division cycle 20, cofactor of APC complex